MAKEFVIKNGLIINDTHTVTGITNDSGLTYNNARLATEDAIKKYIDNSNYWTLNTNVLSPESSGYTINIENDTSSTSPTNGALTVVGGVGINENLNVNNNITTTNGQLLIQASTTSTTARFLRVGQSDIYTLNSGNRSGWYFDHAGLNGTIVADDTNFPFAGTWITGDNGEGIGIATNGNVTIQNSLSINENLTLKSGTTIYDISIDSGFTNANNNSIATTQAIKDYIDANAGGTSIDSLDTQIIFNSGGTLTGSSELTYSNQDGLIVNNKIYTNYIEFNSGLTIPIHKEGTLFYESQSLQFYVDNSAVTLNIGEENWVKCKNNNSLITDGSVVYISGSTGNNPTIGLAQCDLNLDTVKVIGIATHDIASSEIGYITTFGRVNDIDTSAFSDGDELWLSSTPGQLTNVKPEPPNCVVFIGFVIRSHSTVGSILVNINKGYSLDDLSTVKISGATERQLLFYSGDTVWYNDDLLKSDISDFNDSDYLSSSGGTLWGNLIIEGDLTVSGTTTTINTENLNIKDNIILLNSGETGSGVTLGTSGIQIDRGDFIDYQIVFNETTDKVQIGEIGSLENVATEDYVSGYNFNTNDTEVLFNSGGTLTGSSNLTYDGDTLIINEVNSSNPALQVNADGNAKIRLNDPSGNEFYTQITFSTGGTDRMAIEYGDYGDADFDEYFSLYSITKDRYFLSYFEKQDVLNRDQLFLTSDISYFQGTSVVGIGGLNNGLEYFYADGAGILINTDQYDYNFNVSTFNVYSAFQVQSSTNSSNEYVSIGISNDSTSTTTGAFRVDGGVGVAKNLYVGGVLGLASGTTIYNISTDSGFTSTDDNSIATTLAIQNYINTSINSVGSDTQIIFNSGGTLTGSSNLTFDNNILTLSSNTFRITESRTITSSGDTGQVGEISWDENYIYICVANNTWKRTSLASW
jgi:hypothetical protein